MIIIKKLIPITAIALSAVLFAGSAPLTGAARTACADDTKSQTSKITVSFTGDCTLGSDSRYNTNFISTCNSNGTDYFLKNVKNVFTKDDLTLVNFEGTLTESTSRANKTYTFKGSKSYTKILTGSGVEAVNIANNHTKDFGETGYNDTISALKAVGILYSGYSKIAYKRVKGIKIAMIGQSALSAYSESSVISETKKLIKQARKKDADIVITSFHWGIEGDYYPNSKQKNIAKAAIDNGSDIVIGHHPHVLQGLSTYKGKYIAYSLGNFCFGGNSNPKDKDTMILQATFEVNSDNDIEDTSLKVILCSLSGSSSRNDFQPRILSGSEKTSLIKKLNGISKDFSIKIKKNGLVTTS